MNILAIDQSLGTSGYWVNDNENGLIKTNKRFSFISNPKKIANADQMVDATRMTYKERRFIFSLRNAPRFTLETKHNFEEGKKEHKKLQKGIKVIKSFKDYIEYRKLLHKHQKVVLKELNVLSMKEHLYGIIDVFGVEYTKDKVLNIEITELKPVWKNSHFIQLMCYCIICADTGAKLIYGAPYKRKTGEKREIGFLYPNSLKIKYINMKARIYEYRKKKKYFPYYEVVGRNEFLENYPQIVAGIKKKQRNFQNIMKQQFVDICAVPYCIINPKKGECSKDNKTKYCGWQHLCNKFPFSPKSKQMYMSLNKINHNKDDILIKTKPKVVI